MGNVSPKYQAKFVAKVEDALWDLFDQHKYHNVELYIEKWVVKNNDNYLYGTDKPPVNFKIYKNVDDNIDLKTTLNRMPFDVLLKIAIDLGVETPDIIPGMAFFRNEIKAENETASQVFEKAFKRIESDPDDAIGFANSALESIIKEMLADERIKVQTNNNDTLYKLTTAILKEFKLYPKNEMPKEIKTIGSSLLTISQGVESLRSDQTDMHGKTKEDVKIEDPMYAYFIVNAVTTVGLFLKSFYNEKFPVPEPKAENEGSDDDELPF